LQEKRADAARDRPLASAPTFAEDRCMDAFERELVTVARLLDAAERVLFITGAGISADSGLPTYRGIGGLYNDRHTDDGLPIEVALSGDMLAARPEITWKYLAEIEANCRGAGPNAAHHVIARLAATKRVTVLTQNIDGLHRAAGSQDVIEIHGTLHRLSCTECGARFAVEDYSGLEFPPACPDCGALLRPDVVLFGEALPPAAIPRLVEVLEAGPDLIFSIGTTSVFPYIAEPVLFGRQNGIPTVEINPGESQVSDLVDIRLPLGAAATLQAIEARLR
jgi:NAD-dependent deacetylase